MTELERKMDCSDVVLAALLPAYLDKSLSEQEAQAVEQHVFVCEACLLTVQLHQDLHREQPLSQRSAGHWWWKGAAAAAVLLAILLGYRAIRSSGIDSEITVTLATAQRGTGSVATVPAGRQVRLVLVPVLPLRPNSVVRVGIVDEHGREMPPAAIVVTSRGSTEVTARIERFDSLGDLTVELTEEFAGQTESYTYALRVVDAATWQVQQGSRR